MIKKKVGLLTLAFTLISLGTLFLLDNFSDLNLSIVLSIAWPIIIILFGLELIITKTILERKNNDIKISISGGSLTLLIIIVLILSFASNINFNESWISISDIDIFSLGDVYKYESEYNKKTTIEAKGKEKFILDNHHGSVDIQGGASDKIEIDYTIIIRNNDEIYAKEVANDILEISENEGNVVKLESKIDKYIGNKSEIKGIEVNYTIKLPKDKEIDITTAYGDVKVENIEASVNISNRHGDIIAKYIGNNIELKNSYGNIEVEDIKGKTDIENKHGNILAKKIEKRLDLVNSYGNIIVADINDNVEIENTHDRIKVSNINGDVNINSRYCGVEIEAIKGDLKVNGEHENMFLKEIDGNVNASNKYARIELIGASKSIVLRNKNANILFESDKTLTEGLEIENEFGNVEIRIPKEQQGEFRLFTRHGHISDVFNDFGFKIEKESNEERVNESIKDSQVRFNIRTNNGDIEVRAN